MKQYALRVYGSKDWLCQYEVKEQGYLEYEIGFEFKYAKRFSSKKEAYKFAWLIFRLNKYSVDLYEVKDNKFKLVSMGFTNHEDVSEWEQEN